MFQNKFEVTEVCPNCESEVTMVWDVKQDGYKAFCPVCGGSLMLCDMCHHRGEDGAFVDDCDYDSKMDTCRFNRGDGCKWISVMDVLPEENVRVLTLSRWGHVSDRAMRTHLSGVTLFDPDGLEPGKGVTHWMPMPKLPAREKGAPK